MHKHADIIAAHARACVGTRFRAQGRAIGIGLDCIGVALLAAAAAGILFDVPLYALGGDREAQLDAGLARQGCVRVDPPRPGDLIVAAPAPGRRHLGVMTSAGVVHAHAGLGRVVEGPLDPEWQIVGAWRFPDSEA
ncbi:peptidoglycan endopeptidase [Sphingosinicellaceae bacterium]|nr:peptidoglycan endopeptidase [Sphingosinicellaceae bacterium]